MAENNGNNFEHEISEKLKALDAQVKIPEIPDAQAIFERAEQEKPKNNVIKFKYIGTMTAAAAVVIMLIAIPAIRNFNNSLTGGKSADAAFFDNEENENAGAPEEYNMEENYFEGRNPAGEVGLEDSMMLTNPNAGGGDYGEHLSKTYDVLYNYFYGNMSSSMASEKVNGSDIEQSFSETINNKRSIDIGIESDSVSVMFYDNSGEREVLSAFWVEGKYQSSYESDGYYVINVVNEIAREDFESGNYMPLIGDANLGTYSLSEDKVAVPDIVLEAKFYITVEINIETGEYEIYASLE